jgi:hypothetical protein
VDSILWFRVYKLEDTEDKLVDTDSAKDEENRLILSAKDAELFPILFITEFIEAATDAELLDTAFDTCARLWEIVLIEDAFSETSSV